MLDAGTLQITEVQKNVTKQYLLLQILEKPLSDQGSACPYWSVNKILKNKVCINKLSPFKKMALLALCLMQCIALVKKSSPYDYK